MKFTALKKESGALRMIWLPRCAALLLSSLGFSPAVEPPSEPPKDARQLLQDGLFEEEASHDFEKAATAYAALIAQFDAQRPLAAMAIFRLAEVRARQGKKDEAALLWQRIVTEFPNHDPLAKLSRDRLAALGMKPAPEMLEAPSDEEARELTRLREIAKNSPDLLYTRSEHTMSPLDAAASKGWLKVADYLLSQGAKIEETPNRYSALVVAAMEGHKAMVDFLIERGAKIDAIGFFNKGADYQYCTALMAAQTFSRTAVFNDLLEQKADVNKTSRQGQTPLLLACERGDLAMCKALLERGADPNIAWPKSTDASHPDPYINELNNGKSGRRTPLYFSMRWAQGDGGNPDLLELLLSKGAKPMVPGGEELTEIEFAIHEKIPKALAVLLPKTPKLTDAATLRLALVSQNQEVLNLVLKNHADVNVKSDGTPMLAVAIYAAWPDAIPALLDAGALPTAIDREGKTPLHALAALPLAPQAAPQPNLGPRRVINTIGAPRPGLLTPPNVNRVQWSQLFPEAPNPKVISPLTISMNQDWEKRRPLFEALLAKGADINALDLSSHTPLFALLQGNSFSTDAVAWFVSKGADILKRYPLPTGGELAPSFSEAAYEMRPELARRFVFPKLAKADQILLWEADNRPIDKPQEFKRAAEGEAPPSLEEIFAKSTPGRTSQPAAVVVNRPGPDGKWTEAAMVRVEPGQQPDWPRLQWGDAIFFSASSNRTGGLPSQ